MSCLHDKECIKLHTNTRRSVAFTSSSQTTLQRFRNALIHLKNITAIDPIYKGNNIDPFEVSNFDIINTNSVTITNIIFKDQNNNNRIDENERVTLALTIRSYNAVSVENLTIDIKDLNKVNGLNYDKRMVVPAIGSNQPKNVIITPKI